MKVQNLGIAPEKSRPTDAAYDLRANVWESVLIQPGDSKLIPTGLQIAIPEGYAGLVCSRSGLALNWGVSVLNAPGIVDPGYIGDVGVILHNSGQYPFAVNHQDRIAQLMFVKSEPVEFIDAKSTGLAKSERGQNGFGSSGVA